MHDPDGTLRSVPTRRQHAPMGPAVRRLRDVRAGRALDLTVAAKRDTAEAVIREFEGDERTTSPVIRPEDHGPPGPAIEYVQ